MGDATVAGGAQQQVRSYSQAMCQLSLDHKSASVVPGNVVLPKFGGDQSRMLGGGQPGSYMKDKHGLIA